jgi:hypothetical protein
MLAVIGLIGAGLAAVQLVPLFELGMESARGSGLDRALAATNSVWPGGLLTVLLPGLYDTARGGFWGPWVKWETLLYVGVLPLALALLGLVRGRGPHRFFFGGVAGLAILAALGPEAPIPLWTFLHSLPGFEVLQSPGRFFLLVTVAAAVLAGFGVDALAAQVHPRPRRALVAVGVGTSATVLLAIALQASSSQLSTWASSGAGMLDEYLNRPGVPPVVDGAPLSAARVGELASQAITFTSPATARQLALLLAIGPAVALWMLGPRTRRLAVTVTSALVLADFMLLWLSYHPYGRITDLRPTVPAPLLQGLAPPGAQPYRLFTPPTTHDKLTQVEPNRLLATGLQEAGGYSSIEPSRHAAYAQAVQRAENYLLDLWNVKYLVRRMEPAALPSYAMTSFQPSQPLLSGRLGNAGSSGTLLVDGGVARANAVHVIAALWDADLLANGATVARITLQGPGGTTRTLALRAGHHVSDSRIDVPGRPRRAQHDVAEVAYQYQRANPAAPQFGQQLYHAHLIVDPPMDVQRVTIDMVASLGGLEVYGVGLFDAQTGEITQVRDKAKFHSVYGDAQISVLENTAALPRAFLVERAVTVMPGQDALSLMLDTAFDPRSTVVLDPTPGMSASGPGDQANTPVESAPQASTGDVRSNAGQDAQRLAPTSDLGQVQMVRYGDEEIVLRVEADRTTYLVLSDPYFPGWVARLDGRQVPILRANYLFRAVAVPPGAHNVRFAFEPLSVAFGAALSLVALVVLLGVTAAHAAVAIRGRLPSSRRIPTGAVPESPPTPAPGLS